MSEIKHWLVRGDCHGEFDWIHDDVLADFKSEKAAIIILGDAGINFWLDGRDKTVKKIINNEGFRIYVVHGNHEARASDIESAHLIYDQDVQGEVYIEDEYPNIRYFKMFGEYKINNYNVAVIGGAYSVDKWYRLSRAGITSEFDPEYTNPKKSRWFWNEQLSAQEMDEAAAVFNGKEYDFVFSHTCPISWQPYDLFLPTIDQTTVDRSMENFLEKIKGNVKWGVWLFGHYHKDRIERPHVEMLYESIWSLEYLWDRWKKFDNNEELYWWLRKSPNFYMT